MRMQSTIHAYLYPSKTFIQWADKSSDGRDNRHSVHHGSRLSISIHVSRTGNDTAVGVRRRVVRVISIRASHMESDLKRSRNSSIVCIFQSTLPAWGATAALTSTKSSSQNFNPRSPRGERRRRSRQPSQAPRISIHAPRVGSDGVPAARERGQGISIHAPRVGSDSATCSGAHVGGFQSTLPAWGATLHEIKLCEGYTFQSTLPAWGATLSIQSFLYLHIFQSTLPAWGATDIPRAGSGKRKISIHAPRVGSDVSISSAIALARYFNPRSPRGERHHLNQCRQ